MKLLKFRFSYSFSIFHLTTVSESVCILASFPLRDRSKWFHWKEHQEELPCHAPVHGEVSPNWSSRCTRQPQNRVKRHFVCMGYCDFVGKWTFTSFTCMTFVWNSSSATCTSFMRKCVPASVCVCVCLCVTGHVRLWMNGFPHWEQRALFLVLDSIVGQIVWVCEGGGERGSYQSNQEDIQRVGETFGWMIK